MATVKEIRAMAEAARAAQTPRQRQQAEDARKLAAYPALVAACQAVVAAFTTPIGVPVRKAFTGHPAVHGTYLSPAAVMVSSEVYELARDALAAAEESTQHELG